MTDRRLREDDEEREFFAVRIDMTDFIGKEHFQGEYGVVPAAVYVVYVTDMRKVFQASLSPDVEMWTAYQYALYPEGVEVSEEIQEAIQYDISEDWPSVESFSWHDINRKRGTKDMVSIGEFDSLDDAYDYLVGNWVL